MQNLTRASRELFRRSPDETYPSLDALVGHCRRQREASVDHWVAPTGIRTRPVGSDDLLLTGGEDKVFQMTDWSFGQLCRLAGVTKETVNRLSPDTASRVFGDRMHPEQIRPSAIPLEFFVQVREVPLRRSPGASALLHARSVLLARHARLPGRLPGSLQRSNGHAHTRHRPRPPHGTVSGGSRPLPQDPGRGACASRRGCRSTRFPSRRSTERIKRPALGIASPGHLPQVSTDPILRLHQGPISHGRISRMPRLAGQLPSDLFGATRQSRAMPPHPGTWRHSGGRVLAGDSPLVLGFPCP